MNTRYQDSVIVPSPSPLFFPSASPTPKLQSSPSKRQPTPVDWAREEFFATMFDHIVPQLRMNNKTPPNKLMEQHRNIRNLVESVRVETLWRSPPSPAIYRPLPNDTMIHVAPVIRRRTPISNYSESPEPSNQYSFKSDDSSKSSGRKIAGLFGKMKNAAKNPFRRIGRK
ncbi:hypothetical protein VKS41_006439 [Umbelopsis sp. WA50703]|jgi:hypothetical protein